MTAAILVFAGLGASVTALLILIARPRPSLLAAIGRLEAPRVAVPLDLTPPRSWTDHQVHLGRRARDWLAQHTRPGRTPHGPAGQRGADLAITGRSDELLLGQHIVCGVAGFLALPAFALALAPAGAQLPAAVFVVGCPALAAGFGWLPQLALRRDGEARRREFRHGLSSYLDLVAMSLAGGRGAPQALAETADLSDAWSFRMLSDALATARLTGTNHWRGLGDLGHRLAIPELVDLAASLALVGDHGARVRETLAARAATLRRRAIADAEGNAAEADQAMRIAQVLLALGFLVLVAYPALAGVLAM